MKKLSPENEKPRDEARNYNRGMARAETVSFPRGCQVGPGLLGLYLIVALIAIVAARPLSASAAVIASQTDDSVQITTNTGSPLLGTGLSGRFSALTATLQSIGSGTADINYRIVCATSNTYATECGGGTNGEYNLSLTGQTLDGVKRTYTVTGIDRDLVFDPTMYYYIATWPNSNWHLYGSGTGTASQNFIISDTPPFDYSTHFIAISPLPGSTVATTTTVTASVYVAPGDYSDGMKVVMEFQNQAVHDQKVVSAASAWDSTPASDTFVTFAVTQSGTSTFNQSVTFSDPGVTLGTYSFTGGNALVSATSTVFTVGYLNARDIQLAAVHQSIVDYFNGTVSTSTADSACNFFPGGATIAGCVSAMVKPTPAQMNELFNSAKNGFFQAFPFGYVTRLMVILNGTSTLQMPPISYTFGSSSPAVLQGKTYSIDLFTPDTFQHINEVRADDGTNKGVWDIIDPFVTILVGIAVFGVIINDLLGLSLASSGGYSVEDTIPDEGTLTKQQSFAARVRSLRDSEPQNVR